MATAHCYARAYSVSNANYVTVSDEDNMYEAISTSDTSYATLQGRTRNSSTAYYCFINNFKLDEVPSNAQVSAISVKIRCYKNSQQRTGTNYYLRLCSSANWNNVISNTTTSTNIGTSTATITIPTGNVTWANIVNTYKTGFSIAVPLAGNSGSNPPRIYVYGAEIEVTYTAETVHVTGVSVSPSTASIEVGETTTLTETVAPSNASNKNVTWSTNNSSVATVSSGVVTGVSAGSATITVTTVDGSYTARCAVTVTQPVMHDYVLASTLEPGKTYLIANGNSGTVYIMSNEAGGSRQLKGVQTTISNGKISISGSVQSKCAFDCELYDSNNSITTVIKSGNAYLYSDSGTGLRFYETASMNRFWHLNGTKFWLFKSTTTDGWTDTSSEYKYYLEVSNGNFTDNHLTSPAVADTTLPAMYLFTPDTGSTDTILFKDNGAWVTATKVYKKTNGSWVEQSDLTAVFDSLTNYRKG